MYRIEQNGIASRPAHGFGNCLPEEGICRKVPGRPCSWQKVENNPSQNSFSLFAIAGWVEDSKRSFLLGVKLKSICYHATAWTLRSVTKIRWSEFYFSPGARFSLTACRHSISRRTSPRSFISVTRRSVPWLPF